MWMAMWTFVSLLNRALQPRGGMITRVRVVVIAGWGLTLAFAAPIPVVAQDNQGWLGKQVVEKHGNFTLRIGDKVVDRAHRIEIYRVERVEGPWLWLRTTGLQGWALATEVVPVEEAVAFFTTKLIANSGDIHAYTMRAIVRQDNKDFEMALADYSEAIRSNPAQAWLFNNRGHHWNLRHEYDRAIADCSEAIRLKPMEPTAYHNRGIAWAEKGQYDKAITDYNEAIRLDPRNAVAHHNRGTALVHKKEFEKALADYDEAIHLDPHFAQAYCCRGTARWAKKEIDKALADFDEAIRLDPKEPMAYHNRGYAWGAKKVFDKAVADFDEALRLDPQYVQASKGRAWAVALSERSDADALDGMRTVVTDRQEAHRPIGE